MFDPSTSDVGLSTSDVGPSTSDAGPSTSNVGPSTSDVGPSTCDVDPSTCDVGPSTCDVGPCTTCEVGPSTSGVGLFTSDVGPSTSGILNARIDEDVHIREESMAPSDDEKIEQLVESVVRQGKIGKMVLILDHFENPYKSLQKAVAYANMDLAVIKETDFSESPDKSVYVLKIDDEELARGDYSNMQSAKRHLARCAVDRLFLTCFVIYKKAAEQPIRSKAHQLLTDMEWISRGVFSEDQDQGKVLVCKMSNRPEAPGYELLDIPKILEEFLLSPKYLVLMLHVDLDFGGLLMVALRVNELGLKLTTSDKSHKTLIISKKITRIDVVKELLKNNGQDEIYELKVPKLFQ